MDFLPKVSIVIPVYNGANFLSQAIDSALAQTYSNIEVLVINDGSTDDGETERIALSYDNKVRYFAKINGGVASALNLGILEMKGDYFSWLSHDDLYMPEKIEREVEYLASLPDKETVIYSDYVNTDENNKDLYPVHMDHELLMEKPLYSVFRGSLHGCTLLIPRAAFISSGIFNNLRTTQDYDLWFRMIRNHRFVHLPEILVRSRLHAAQGSRHLDATAEANDLWIRMMKSLTPDEVLSLENSAAAFYEGMASFLANTPYTEALNFARKRASYVSADEYTSRNKSSAWSSRELKGKGLFLIKKSIKKLLITLGMWEYTKKLRYRKSPDDSDNKRTEDIFIEISKILLKVSRH